MVSIAPKICLKNVKDAIFYFLSADSGRWADTSVTVTPLYTVQHFRQFFGVQFIFIFIYIIKSPR